MEVMMNIETQTYTHGGTETTTEPLSDRSDRDTVMPECEGNRNR